MGLCEETADNINQWKTIVRDVIMAESACERPKKKKIKSGFAIKRLKRWDVLFYAESVIFYASEFYVAYLLVAT